MIKVIFSIALFLSIPSIVIGQAVINEIAWMGGPAFGIDSKQEWRHEWLELYNSGENSLSVDEWSIELYRGEELYFTIPLLGTIPQNEYFLVGASDKISGVDVNYANLGGKLVNDGMKVILKNSTGEIVDKVDSSSGWQAGDNANKRTMEKAENTWQTSTQIGGTPRRKNSEGFEELVSHISALQTKRDPSGSLQDFFGGGTILLAFLLALASSLLILGVSRFLVRRP